MTARRMVIFDRDGTLTYEAADYHRDLSRVRSYPFAGPLLKRLEDQGCLLAVATNQSGIGRGFWTRAEVDRLHSRLGQEWEVPLSWHLCPHHPDDHCPCRKPLPALVQEALDKAGLQAAEALMVGDSPADAQAAAAAGVEFALVLTGKGRQTRSQLGPGIPILETVADLEVQLA